MMNVPLGIERISRVQYSQGDTEIKVRVEIIPANAMLPAALGKPGAYAVTLDDAERTAVHVSAVSVLSAPAVVLVLEVPTGVTSGRFTIRAEGMVPGLDSASASWGSQTTVADPRGDAVAPARRTVAPIVPNYLYRDYASYKQLMLDVLHRENPRLRDTHEADTGIAVVEVLAYAADLLTYYQDAVATEAYLETARRRTSIRRHTRLLDYRLYEGCAPRVWMHICPNAPMMLPANHQFSTRRNGEQDARVFESLAICEAHPGMCDLEIWDFDGAERAIHAGATTAIIDAPRGAAFRAGDALLFAQHDTTASVALVVPQQRQMVRLVNNGVTFDHPRNPLRALVQITWYAEDALLHSYDIARNAAGRRPSYVRGNMIQADFGETIDDPSAYFLDNHRVLRAPIADLTFAVPPTSNAQSIAAEARDLRPANAVPQITAVSHPYGLERQWRSRIDLIGADPYARVFAVETERNGSVTLRFGDGINGAQPTSFTRFTLRYRQGAGTVGHVGPRAVDQDGFYRGVAYSAHNPMPSFGGVDRQDADEARREAPERLRSGSPKRCISDVDYVACALNVYGVRSASVLRRWTGSGVTAQVYVDGDGDAKALQKRVLAALMPMRVVGTSLNVRGPRFVGVVVRVTVRIKPGASSNDVARRVSRAIAEVVQRESLTLGSAVYASWFIAAAMSATGVLEADLSDFGRLDGTQATEPGVLRFAATEKPMMVDELGLATGGRALVVVAS